MIARAQQRFTWGGIVAPVSQLPDPIRLRESQNSGNGKLRKKKKNRKKKSQNFKTCKKINAIPYV